MDKVCPDDFCSVCKQGIDEDFYKILSVFEEAPERSLICDECFNVTCVECWAEGSQLSDFDHHVCLNCEARIGSGNLFKNILIKAGFKDIAPKPEEPR